MNLTKRCIAEFLDTACFLVEENAGNVTEP